ncbi:MAG: hypothetical protein JWR15_2070 [Prosthecobacter sp.]|nr:hypothetical protein [Prosthecobacter sp.]
MIWVVLSVLIVGGLAGAMGKGLLAQRKIKTAAGEIEFERVLRHQSPAEISFTFDRDMKGTPTITLPRHMLEKVQVRSVSPLPLSQAIGSECITYEFKKPPQTNGRVVFSIIPTGIGSLQAGVLIGDGTTVKLPITILP